MPSVPEGGLVGGYGGGERGGFGEELEGGYGAWGFGKGLGWRETTYRFYHPRRPRSIRGLRCISSRGLIGFVYMSAIAHVPMRIDLLVFFFFFFFVFIHGGLLVCVVRGTTTYERKKPRIAVSGDAASAGT